jgi:hypothetical protein
VSISTLISKRPERSRTAGTQIAAAPPMYFHPERTSAGSTTVWLSDMRREHYQTNRRRSAELRCRAWTRPRCSSGSAHSTIGTTRSFTWSGSGRRMPVWIQAWS